MDPGLPKYPGVPRRTLDNLVTLKRHAPAPLAHLALGQCAVGSLRRTVGTARPTVSTLRTTPRHYRAPAPHFLPSLATLFHKPLDPLLGEWHQQARDWLLTATTNDLKQVSCLRIPSRFIATIPLKAMAQIRYRVAWFQYHILLGVTALRGTLPMPPRAPGRPIAASTSISPWYGKLRGRTIQPNPTEKNLSEQVRFCQAKRKRRPVRTPQTRCPAKQAVELLQVPLTTARKSRILRPVHMCDSTVKQQLLDFLQEADPPPPTGPPRPVLLLEHCTEVAIMVRDFQWAAAQSMERRHLVTHWGACLNTYLQYVLRQRTQAMGQATKIYLAAAWNVCQRWQQHHAHALFTVKDAIFIGQAKVVHHSITHTLFSTCHARALRSHRHTSMAAICSHATFLLG